MQQLKAIDPQMALRIYGWAMALAGVVVMGMGLADSNVFGTPVLAVVFGTMLLSAGFWSGSLSQINDQALRRKGLAWFLGVHMLVLNIIGGFREEIWGHLPKIVDQAIQFAILAIGFILIGRTGKLAVTSKTPNGSSYEKQMREAGAQEERNRLARDLHDSIKQQIFVIQTAAATAQTRFDDDRPGASDALEQIRNSARDAMTEMEAMMDNLRSVPLENTSLVEALKKQCEALGHRTGAKVEFKLGDLPANDTLAPGAHQAIFRVAQEALANVGRHARATHVTVSLGTFSERLNLLELRIQDDGTGFDAFDGPRGMGIANMKARAVEFRGWVDVTSIPGTGTTVAFSIPYTVIPKLSSGTRIVFGIFAVLMGLMLYKIADKEYARGNYAFPLFFVAFAVIGTARLIIMRLNKAKTA